MFKGRKILCALLFLSLASSPAFAEIFRVDPSKSESGAGDTWANALGLGQFRSKLQSTTGHEFWLKKGWYTPGSTHENSFLLKDGTRLYGGFAGDEKTRDERNPSDNVTVLTGDIQNNDTKNSDGVTERWGDINEEGGDNSKLIVLIQGGTTETPSVIDGITLCGGSGHTSNKASGIQIEDGYACIENCSIVGNKGEKKGGALFARSADVLVSGCAFEYNRSDENGGGIYAEAESDIKIHNSSFTGCICSDDEKGQNGGALYSERSKISAYDSLFEENVALEGGGINVSGDTSTINGCTFRNNSAEFGGAGIRFNNTISFVQNCTFEENHVGLFGGAVRAVYGAHVHIHDCEFTKNTSSRTGNGGAISSYNSTVSLNNCSLSGNVSRENSHGGAMCVKKGSFDITCCTFNDNSSLEKGGAIDNGVDSSTRLVNCTLCNNTGLKGGGAIFSHARSTLDVVNCTFSNNSTNEAGYAVLHKDASNEYSESNVVNCIIRDGGISEIECPATTILNIRHSILQGTTSPDLNVFDSDPGLYSLSNNGGPTPTMKIDEQSSAYNKGTTNDPILTPEILSLISKDQRGENRTSEPDLGAYECQYVPPTPPPGPPPGPGDNDNSPSTPTSDGESPQDEDDPEDNQPNGPGDGDDNKPASPDVAGSGESGGGCTVGVGLSILCLSLPLLFLKR